MFATAHDALFAQAGLQAGERLLVNGAAGGVGVAAVQLGARRRCDRHRERARHHHDELRALGADTEIEGDYDVILELVGGENLATNLEQLALKGRIVVIGTGAGSKAEIELRPPDAQARPDPRLDLRGRTGEEKAEVDAAARRDVLPLLARPFTVPVEATFPLEQAQEAYERFAAGGKFGKLVICP